jgi:small subunit ribosomal protein S5
MMKNNTNSDFIEKVVSIRKVSKTVKGGKNFSFVVLAVVGDKNGKVGYGKGSAREVPDARNKAMDCAKKNMVRVSLKEGRTIHHYINVKFCASRVMLRPAPSGTGIIAGGAMRAVLECLGLSDIVAKSIGSSNPYNMVEATFRALKSLQSPKDIAARRSKPVSEVIKYRKIQGYS